MRQPLLVCNDAPGAVEAIAASLGEEAREQLRDLLVEAWVDRVPYVQLEIQHEQLARALAPSDRVVLAQSYGADPLAGASPESLTACFASMSGRKRAALRSAARILSLSRGRNAFLADLIPAVMKGMEVEERDRLLDRCLKLYAQAHSSQLN